MDEGVAALVRRALAGDVLASSEIAAQMELATAADRIVLHQLMHWIADDDIRQRDLEYAAHQLRELADTLGQVPATR